MFFTRQSYFYAESGSEAFATTVIMETDQNGNGTANDVVKQRMAILPGS